jgi:hypothetical protein
MKGMENDYYINRERQYDREQNQAELEHLRSEAEEMRSELSEGTLSEAAKNDLEQRLMNTNQAINILRESLRALAQPDAIVVEDLDAPITVEISDQRAYWSAVYEQKTHELEELLQELANMKNELRSDSRLTRQEKLEADIERLEKEAEQAADNAQLSS